MTDSLHKLDQAIAIARTELSALLDDDVETAQKLCERRAELTASALHDNDNTPPVMIFERLNVLQDIQKELHQEASRQHKRLQQQFLVARNENRRLNGYGKIAAQILH
jgi:hypothetical protein